MTSSSAIAAMCLDKDVERELRSIPGNNICCDCEAKMPQWASVSFGTFMCLECSGRHRALGVHISFIRSVSMDSWTEKQVKQMRMGGNEKCINFLKGYKVEKSLAIPLKYNTAPALLYKNRLLAEIENRPLPTELPKVDQNAAHHGSDPLPGESEADYVARQRRLQDAAKERMREKFGNSSGLSSSGKMGGIGSDPNYRAGSRDSGLASTVSGGWGFLTSNAADLLKSATAVTSDLVQNVASNINNINLNNSRADEDYKFPRPTSGNFSSNSSTGSGSTHVKPQMNDNRNRNNSSSKTSSDFFNDDTNGNSSISSTANTKKKASNDPNGSDPLEGESEADYIVRQKKLQAEAKERMRAKFGSSSGLSSSGKMSGVGSDSSYNSTKSSGSTWGDWGSSLLASAAVITNEFVKDITKDPSDEEFKFPRNDMVNNSNNSGGNSKYVGFSNDTYYSSVYNNNNNNSNNSNSNKTIFNIERNQNSNNNINNESFINMQSNPSGSLSNSKYASTGSLNSTLSTPSNLSNNNADINVPTPIIRSSSVPTSLKQDKGVKDDFFSDW